MKIATYNVNGINARLPVLLHWLASSKPDVACLQELKAPDEKFPVDAIREAGYEAVWHGQKAWNGVAILARGEKPVETRRGLPGDPDDTHSRYIEAVVGGIIVGCLYLPNGNPAPGPKFDYKLRWFERLNAHAAGLLDEGGPVVLAGRLQRHPDRAGRLQARALGRRRPVPARDPRGLPPAARPGLDGCAAAPPPGRDDLHLLGLHAGRLLPQRGPAHRPPAPEPGAGAAAEGRGRRPRRAGDGEDQRPRADVDRIGELSGVRSGSGNCHDGDDPRKGRRLAT